MKTLESLVYGAPMLLGMALAVIVFIVIYTPWRFLWECFLLVTAAVIILFEYWITMAWRKFKKWMQKREPWCDALEGWFAKNFHL